MSLTAEEKLNIMEQEYKIPMEQKLEEGVKVMCNLSQGIKEAGIAVGEKRGMEKGIAEGIRGRWKNFGLHIHADQREVFFVPRGCYKICKTVLEVNHKRIVKNFLQRCRKHSAVLLSRETEEYMKKGHDINLYFRHHRCMMPKKIDKFHNCDNMRI